jgi:hypothetical protein
MFFITKMFRTNPYFGGGLVVQRGPFNEPIMKTKTKTRMSLKPKSHITIINPYRIDGSAPPPKMSRPVTRKVVDRPYPVDLGRPTPGRRLPLSANKIPQRPDLMPSADEFVDGSSLTSDGNLEAPSAPIGNRLQIEPTAPRFNTDISTGQEGGMPPGFGTPPPAYEFTSNQIDTVISRLPSLGGILNTVGSIGRFAEPGFWTNNLSQGLVRALLGTGALTGLRRSQRTAQQFVNLVRDATFGAAVFIGGGAMALKNSYNNVEPGFNTFIVDQVNTAVRNVAKQGQISLKKILIAALVALKPSATTKMLIEGPSMTSTGSSDVVHAFGQAALYNSVQGVGAALGQVVKTLAQRGRNRN